MKRDMELVRSILLAVEALPANGSPMKPCGGISIEGKTSDEITYHLKIMKDAGFIDAQIETLSAGVTYCRIYKMKWQGHEFLDAARDNGTWRKALTRIGSGMGSTSLEVIKAVLVDEAKRGLGLAP